MDELNEANAEVEGIVLSVQDYRESDGIICLLTQDKILSILARGDPETNFKESNDYGCVFTCCAIRSSKKENGLSLLYYGNVIDSHYKIMEDFNEKFYLLCFGRSHHAISW